MQVPYLVFKGVLKATLIKLCFILADVLQINILKHLLLDTVVYFRLLVLISYLDTNKHSNIVEYIS